MHVCMCLCLCMRACACLFSCARILLNVFLFFSSSTRMAFDQQRDIYINNGNDTIQFHHSINNIGGRVIMEINIVANCW